MYSWVLGLPNSRILALVVGQQGLKRIEWLELAPIPPSNRVIVSFVADGVADGMTGAKLSH